MDDNTLKLKLLLMRIQGGHEVDRSNYMINLAVERLYRKGIIMKSNGKLRLTSFGEEILEKLNV